MNRGLIAWDIPHSTFRHTTGGQVRIPHGAEP